MAEKRRRLFGLPFVLLFAAVMVGWELETTEIPDYSGLAVEAAVYIIVLWGLIKFFERFAGRAEPESPSEGG